MSENTVIRVNESDALQLTYHLLHLTVPYIVRILRSPYNAINKSQRKNNRRK